MEQTKEYSLKYDNLKIYSETDLSEYDLVNLRKLYSPIIGSVAISLYSHFFDALSSPNNANSISYRDLSLFLFETPEKIHDARKKLEVFNLIEVFEKHDEYSIIIKLNKPETKERFKNNSLYSKYLRKALGFEKANQLLSSSTFNFNDKSLTNVTSGWVDFLDQYKDYSFQLDQNLKNNKIEFIKSQMKNYSFEDENIYLNSNSSSYNLNLVTNEKNNNLYEVIKKEKVDFYLQFQHGIKLSEEKNTLLKNKISFWKSQIFNEHIINLVLFLTSKLRKFNKVESWYLEVDKLITKICKKEAYLNFEMAEEFVIKTYLESDLDKTSLNTYISEKNNYFKFKKAV
ncbi:hypothetical protein ACJOMT_02275 [Mycoplasmopsis synoviae]|uniref:hypothetical protein n=1 Tax=Mycoplasmopsis synoviae TaxID=2109 RepID=UPI000CA0B896|nr:hypothetical protein [Mycoplasmopsis synoviae]AKJ20746.1 hypothetical protein MSHv_02720 [Mycoplasmopsis synoviae]AQU48069.1 hypothetical protein ADF19_02720 [Mycoplasmopsis synoviae]AWL84304.1 hypothetical protein MSH_02690 [Mycoplasmopsis synoviae]QLE14018.1 hypothetical protein DEH79_02685 [Mycoplasmopsis synoviae]UBX98518.1 hypothetical protein K6986_02070 [Mycoplasmopsis synoviae]